MNKELSLNVMSLADTIRDQVRKTIAATIPDEQINGLIKTEYDSFFAKPVSRGYANEETRSQFQVIIAREIDALVREKIKDEVEKECRRFTDHQWNDSGKKVVEAFMKEYAPVAIAGVSEAIVRSAMQAFQNGQRF